MSSFPLRDVRPAFDFFEGFLITSVLAAIAMGDLLDVLVEEGLNPRTATCGGYDTSLLEASLRYLAQRGLVTKEADGTFQLTTLGREASCDVGYLVWLSGGYGEPLRRLSSFLRGDQSYGVDSVRDGHWVAGGTAMLSRRDVLPHALELLEAPSFERVVDLGCGNARFLISVCGRYGSSGVGVDIDPVVCDAATRSIAAAGLSDQIKVVAGDAVNLDVVPELDRTQLVVTFFLLHEISSRSRETLVEFLRDLASRLPAGAHLLTGEMAPAREHEAIRDRFGPEFTFVHALMRQWLLTEEEWRSALAEGGFEVRRLDPMKQPGGFAILAQKIE
jgi:SAM-dependent methyltransferase